jgi:YD repeat-containing protein
MLEGNVFEKEIDAVAGTNTVVVQAQDRANNLRTLTYEVNVSGQPASFGYDSNGNLTSKTEGGHTWSYEWDAENQLKRILKDGVEIARFAYDPLGRRVEKVAGGNTTAYAYDAADILRETKGAAVILYVHGLGIDEPLATATSAGSLTGYLHADGLGSILKMTDNAGSVGLTRQYDAWGNPEIGAASAGHAFTGREWDPEAGLYCEVPGCSSGKIPEQGSNRLTGRTESVHVCR